MHPPHAEAVDCGDYRLREIGDSLTDAALRVRGPLFLGVPGVELADVGARGERLITSAMQHHYANLVIVLQCVEGVAQ